jgi:LDH2 family malate/lactate/ureidoglycolate dehydrogenase
MTETRPFVSWEMMKDFMVAVFEKEGVPSEDAAVCAEVLLESDRRVKLITDVLPITQ